MGTKRQWFHLSLVVAAAWLSLPATSHAKDYAGDGYAVTMVRPGGDRPCTLFQLVGVSEADPVKPGSPWFVLESTAPEYRVMVATLLAAKASGKNVQVTTTGTISSPCGHPLVALILWP